MSWDTAAAAAAQHVYINGVSDKNVFSVVDGVLDYTLADWAVYEMPDQNQKLDGCLAEIYFQIGEWMDFSLVSNRRKFISANGKPVYLGTDGRIPTGNIPMVYLHLADGEAVNNFMTNRTGKGNFANGTGALQTGSTSPSD